MKMATVLMGLVVCSHQALAHRMHLDVGTHLLGRASYYSRRFNHRPTSISTRAHPVLFDNNRRMCASNVIPLRSRVRVTNTLTGSSTECDVLDSGRLYGRIIDMSHLTAHEIDPQIEKHGVQRVDITVLALPSEVAEAPAKLKRRLHRHHL